jgi:hypothetical protein
MGRQKVQNLIAICGDRIQSALQAGLLKGSLNKGPYYQLDIEYVCK